MKFKLRDYLVFFICICILSICSYYLYWDFHVKPEIRGEEKQGFITYKYKVAQRKFPSRMIWEDAEQMLPIYNKDSIRTDFLSEAIVTLNNGVKIELDPDSMFVLNIVDKKVNIGIEKGSFLVSTTKSLLDPNSFSIQYKGVELSFQDNSGEIKLAENKNLLEIVSNKGGTILTRNNTKETIFEKQLGTLNILDGKLNKLDLDYFDMQPANNVRYFTNEDSKEVVFEWKNPKNLDIIIEISADRTFSEKIISSQIKETNFTRKFEDGIYYWKLKSSSNELSEIRKFRIIKNPPLTLMSPANKSQFKDKNGEVLVNFIWSKRELALSYYFEISNTPAFKNSIFSRTIFKRRISLPLPLGQYYWRVKSSDSIPGANTKSEIFSFTVEKEEPPVSENSISQEEEPKKENEPVIEKQNSVTDNSNNLPNPNPVQVKEALPAKLTNPVLSFPRANSIVDMNKLDSLHFKWGKVTGAKSYNLKFIQQSNNQTILETEVTANNYNFTQLDKLDVGAFLWTVEAIPASEEITKTVTSAKFTITLGEQPAAPETISKGKKEEE